MKKVYHFLLLTLSLISFLFLSADGHFAQAQKLRYDEDSGWKLGLNVGATWQESDMKTVPGLGYGLTFGKALSQRESRFFAFDMRFRYLRSTHKGYSTDRAYGLANNPVFNGSDSTSALNYYGDSLGYIFPNYKMDLHRYSLEGVLTLNLLRERTGIVLYGFGGIGVTDYRITTDQLDANGLPYNYGLIDTTASASNIHSQLNNMRDGKYESNAEGSSERQLTFMPSLGVGLGYQVGPFLALGFEHKVTFALNDLIDGHRWANNNTALGKNDRYHYTAFTLTWHIPGGRNRNNPDKPKPNPADDYSVVPATPQPAYPQPNPNTPPPVTRQKPVIQVTNPASSPAQSAAQIYELAAHIYHIENAQQISFKVNGTETRAFNYDLASKRFHSTLSLIPGNNLVEIRATNEAGTDYQSVIIVYNLSSYPTTPAPIVTITNPPYSPYGTGVSTFNVTATILNVESAQQISYTVNGIPSGNFTYSPVTHAFSSTISLNPGSNFIEIRAVNTAGDDLKTAEINYRPLVQQQPPVVTFTNPTLNPYTVNVNSVSVDASVLNVASQNDITLRINGQLSYNFTYNTSTRQLNTFASLIEGANTFEVTGTNAAGSDSKTITIFYQKPSAQLPLIIFTDPAINPYTTGTAAKTIKATVLYVASKNDIRLKFNGQHVTNFTYNTSTREVSYNATLLNGSNLLEITAVNEAGTDIKSTTLIYERITQNLAPVVTITYPQQNPQQVSQSQATLIASILHIDGAANVNFRVNGVPSGDFNYDASSKVFSANVTLNEGTNTFQITGTNAYGSDTKTQTIVYTVPCRNPIITLLQPQSLYFETSSAQTQISAIISSVQQASDITFKVNGIHTPFTFDANSGTFNAGVTFTGAENTLFINVVNACGSANQTIHVNYRRPLQPPVVTFTVPQTNPHTTTVNTQAIQATILHVNQASQIVYKVNGTLSSDFSFDPATLQFTSTVTLTPGNNVVEITATNADGSDSKTQTIVFRGNTTPCLKPIIAIGTPAANPYSSTASETAFQAVIQHVTSSASLVLTVNGANTPFTFDPATGTFKTTLQLEEGANTVTLTATNNCGSTAQSVSIQYQRPPTPPVVTIVSPGQNPFHTSSGSLILTARILNIDQASQITYTVNGASNTAFAFDPVTHGFSSQLSLSEGNNVLQITATNPDGTDSKSTTVIYKKEPDPCQAPVIVQTHPLGSAETSLSANYNVNAFIGHINGAPSIKFRQNGVDKPFTYNDATKRFEAPVVLTAGPNSFVLIAANKCEEVQVSFVITYNRPATPPVITLISPASSPHSVSSAAFTFTATITHINEAENINFTHVGENQPSFGFDPGTQLFTANVNLKSGENQFEITATNPDGSDSKAAIVIYTPPVKPCDQPTATFIQPSSAPRDRQSESATLQAQLTGINTPEQLTFRQNGRAVNFNYTASTGSFSAEVRLVNGNNVFELTATNTCGSVTATTTIDYRKPEPPLITLTNPATSPQTVAEEGFVFTANVRHVTQPSQLSLRVNGQAVSQFNFDAGTGNFSAQVTLVNGNNSFELSANNTDGSDTKAATVVYTKPAAPCYNPEIRLTEPAQNSVTVEETSFPIKITLSHITAQQQVKLTHNGEPIDFALSGTTVKTLTTRVDLLPGTHHFEVTATNNCGTSTLGFTATHNRRIQPPVVKFTTPAESPHTVSAPSFLVSAKVSHVQNASDIQFKVNGATQTNFVFNPLTQDFSAPATLVNGANAIEITATNADGSDSKSTVIIYQACEVPTVQLLQPTSTSLTVQSPVFRTEALLAYVPQQSAITFTHNGNRAEFNFNPTTSRFSASLTLNPGANTLQVRISTSCGSTELTLQVNYERGSNLNEGNTGGITEPTPPPGNSGTGAQAGQQDAQDARLERNYRAKIEQADREFDAERYVEARALYVQALELKPAEPYPAQRIAECDAKIAGQQQRLQEQQNARQRAEQEAARIKAEQEAERKRQQEEAARIKAEQEAAARQRANQEAARIKAEQEAARIKAEQEAARIRAEQDAARLRAEQEAAKVKARQEAERIKQEQEAARIKAEQEAARIQAEQEAAKIKARQEAERKQKEEEEEEKQKPEEEQENEGEKIIPRGKLSPENTEGTLSPR